MNKTNKASGERPSNNLNYDVLLKLVPFAYSEGYKKGLKEGKKLCDIVVKNEVQKAHEKGKQEILDLVKEYIYKKKKENFKNLLRFVKSAGKGKNHKDLEEFEKEKKEMN